MLTIHLFNHEGSPEEQEESRIAHLDEHMRWGQRFADQLVRRARRTGSVILQDDGCIALTDLGREHAHQALVQ